MENTGSTKTVIQDLFSFIVSEETTQYGIDTTVEEDITNEEIMSSLVPDATMVIAAQMGPEFLSVQV